MHDAAHDTMLIETLRDAGCDNTEIKKFLILQKQVRKNESIRLLGRHRRALLETVHAYQKKVDTLDHVIYTLEKGDSPSLKFKKERKQL